MSRTRKILKGIVAQNSPAEFEERKGFWCQGDCVLIQAESPQEAIEKYREKISKARIGINHNYGCSSIILARKNTKTEVVNLRLETYDVRICRPSIFGNPWTHIKGKTLADFQVETREESIEKYRIYFEKRIKDDPEFREAVYALKGLRLGCFCAPKSCHGNIIAEYLDNLV